MTHAERLTATLPRASIADTLSVVSEVWLPTIAMGVLFRRPRMVGMSQGLGLNDRAVRRLQSLRRKYGAGPLLLAIPGRQQAVVLSPAHVGRVLHGAPEPFSPATSEKRSALGHFEPEVVLASAGADRAERRRINEAALQPRQTAHHGADRFLAVMNEEVPRILAAAVRELDWSLFRSGWYRMVRRIVFGDAAAGDEELIDMLDALRRRGNWGFLAPKRRKLRDELHGRLADYLEHPQPGSLAAYLRSVPQSDRAAPTHQISQWLFAFDAAAIATFRTLGMLAVHPEYLARARSEAEGETPLTQLSFLRACMMDTLRLWPTTPAILRETTTEVHWETGSMPAHTHLLIFAPFFHRDDENLSFAHQFRPNLWLGGDVADWPMVPFSKGPAECPGRQVVLLLASATLARLIAGRKLELRPGSGLDDTKRLPGAFDHSSLRFTLVPEAQG